MNVQGRVRGAEAWQGKGRGEKREGKVLGASRGRGRGD